VITVFFKGHFLKSPLKKIHFAVVREFARLGGKLIMQDQSHRGDPLYDSGKTNLSRLIWQASVGFSLESLNSWQNHGKSGLC